MNLTPYKDLLYQYDHMEDAIPYSELLKTKEWWDKRNEIITRDGYCCDHCGSGETIKVALNGKEQHCFVNIPEKVRRYRVNFSVNGECDHFYIYDERDFNQIELFKTETNIESKEIQQYRKLVLAGTDLIGIVKEPGITMTTVSYPDGWELPIPTKHLIVLPEAS